MDQSPFEQLPLYHYKVNDMLYNIKIMKRVYKSINFLIYNYIDGIHNIHNILINSPRLNQDIIQSIENFKVIQHDFITNINVLAKHKFTDGKDAINFSYNNETSNDITYSLNEYWQKIHKIPYRTFTIIFDDKTELVILNTPSIQINLDLNNRDFSLRYFTKEYDKLIELNSTYLSKVLKYINNNTLENTDIAISNLLKFYESIYNKTNIPNHDIHLLETKLDLILHELNGVEKLIKVRSKTQSI